MLKSLREAYAGYRLRYPVYFFHHIPKCGGTSVRRALEQWFHINNDYYSEYETVDTSPLDITKYNSANCVCGHFGHHGYHIYQRYPQIFDGYRATKRYRAFMFLRDPLEMRCSLYRHELKKGRARFPDLASAIMENNNYYARIMGVDWHHWQERFDDYFFVGDADQLQNSFDVLAELINKPKLQLPVTNTTTQKRETSIDSLSDYQIEEFKKANEIDYAMFDLASSRVATLSTGLKI